MTCVICKTKFNYTSYSSPAQPCDCAAEIDRADADRMDPALLRRMQAQWKAHITPKKETA